MAAQLGNAAILNDDDAIGITNGRETVSNDKAGTAFEQLVHAFLDQRLGEGIHAAGGFVHDEDFRVRQDGSGQTDKLFLTH